MQYGITGECLKMHASGGITVLYIYIVPENTEPPAEVFSSRRFPILLEVYGENYF